MIMLVTDRRRLSPDATETQAAQRLVALVEAAAVAGIDLVQLRERDLDARALVTLMRQCLSAVSGTKTRVLVNDRLDVAVVSGADGVHLRADSIDAQTARSLLPDGALLGRSVHSANEATAQRHVDFLVLGTLFPSASKPALPHLTSCHELSAVCRASAIPVLAIGGMTIERASTVARAGAAGIAAIGLFIPPSGESARTHLRKVAADVRHAFDTCGAVP